MEFIGAHFMRWGCSFVCVCVCVCVSGTRDDASYDTCTLIFGRFFHGKALDWDIIMVMIVRLLPKLTVKQVYLLGP